MRNTKKLKRKKFCYKKIRNGKGITLIALVITIIVLLILAGVSIMMLAGDNNILSQAIKAKYETIIGQEKEQIGIAYSSAIINKSGEDVTAIDLQEELDNSFGDNNTKTINNGGGILSIEILNTGNYYSVENKKIYKYVSIDVSELESKLEEYKDIVGQIYKYTQSTYDDFMEQYEFAERIVQMKKGTENVAKNLIDQLDEKYNLLKEREIPVIKKAELSTDGTNIILRRYVGDNLGNYYQVVEHRVCNDI